MLSAANHLVSRNRALAVACLVALAISGGCHERQQPTQQSMQPQKDERSAPQIQAISMPKYQAVSNDGTYFVAYQPTPDPIPLNRLFGLRVFVFSDKDHSTPIRDVQLRADAAMPEHDHGMNTKPKIQDNADGSFTVSGMQFHMPGRWEVYLDVTRAGVTERAQFNIPMD